MTVLMDARSAGSLRITGWERYTRNLASIAVTIPEIVALTNGNGSIFSRIASDWVGIPSALRTYDSVHYPSFPPAFTKVPERSLITIHDLTWWKYPETSSRLGLAYYKPLMERIAKRPGQLIATVSETVADEIRNMFPRSKVSVISNVVELEPGSGTEFDNPRPYFLAVGSVEPRKNLDRLVEGFGISRLGSDFDLILVGRNAWGELPKGVKFTGRVSDEELVGIYQGAQAVVAASLYEGFGLPVVEATALGVPVVASDIPVFREVAPEGTVYFDPLSPEAIADALHRVVRAPERRITPQALYTRERCRTELLTAYELFD